MSTRIVALLAASLALTLPHAAQRSTLARPDRGSWAEGFGARGTYRGRLLDWEVFDDGSGPAVYAAGWFRGAGSQVANGVARWDGERWQRLGSGIGFSFAQEVRTLEVFDDGSGPELYAGGRFDRMDGQPASGFARWDGSRWEVLPGQTGFGIDVLRAGFDENGPALFAGGEFVNLGTSPARNVGRWTASGWSSIGTGLPVGPVHALALYDGGGEVALYAGVENAQFPTVQGTLWRSRGGVWSEIPQAPLGPIYALHVHDDGGGPLLYCGGNFRGAGGFAAEGLVSFDGTSFGFVDTINVSATVNELVTLPRSSGPDLLVIGGFIVQASGIPVRNVAAWDGTSFQALGNPAGVSNEVEALGAFDTGGGPVLYAGGLFYEAGGVPLDNAAAWDGVSWGALGDDFGLDGAVSALDVYEGDLILGGSFEAARGLSFGNVAAWDGESLHDLAGGVWSGGTSSVNALVSYASGDGPVLMAGGFFSRAGGQNGVAATNVARWNGDSWSPAGAGLVGRVHALEVFDDGSQPFVIAGGQISFSGSFPLSGIARWNGSLWYGLEGGVTAGSFVPEVYALAVHDDGSGPALYVGGQFEAAGGVPASGIARWTGTSWSALPGGGVTRSGSTPQVRSLLSIDEPSLGGRVLVVGGSFDAAGGVPAQDIAVLGPGGWSAIGTNYPGGSTRALTTFDAGGGPSLVAGGSFYDDTGLRRWDGSRWQRLGGAVRGAAGSVTPGSVATLLSFDDGSGASLSGPSLWVGGTFEEAGARFSRYLARWSSSRPVQLGPTRR